MSATVPTFSSYDPPKTPSPRLRTGRKAKYGPRPKTQQEWPTAENPAESRSAGPSHAVGQPEEAAGHTCTESARSTLDVPSGPAADTQSPRRLHKPRVHWCIGLSERNERRPPERGQPKPQSPNEPKTPEAPGAASPLRAGYTRPRPAQGLRGRGPRKRACDRRYLCGGT